jgi:hypothetical protein
VAAARRSDGMALFARLYHFAGLVGSHEATVSSDVCRQNRRQPSLHTLTRREVDPRR